MLEWIPDLLEFLIEIPEIVAGIKERRFSRRWRACALQTHRRDSHADRGCCAGLVCIARRRGVFPNCLPLCGNCRTFLGDIYAFSHSTPALKREITYNRRRLTWIR